MRQYGQETDKTKTDNFNVNKLEYLNIDLIGSEFVSSNDELVSE